MAESLSCANEASGDTGKQCCGTNRDKRLPDAITTNALSARTCWQMSTQEVITFIGQ